MRVRIKYSIKGKIRFISHLDLMRVFFRACIKEDIPVEMSKGFSPHLKISFGHPLSVGMTSDSEFLDIHMKEPVDLEQIKERIQKGLPEGIEVLDVSEVEKNAPSLTEFLCRVVYSIKIPTEKTIEAAERIRMYANPLVKNIELKNSELFINSSIGQRGNVKPITVLQDLWPDIEFEELKLWQINREELHAN